MTGPHIRARSQEDEDLETGMTLTRIDVLQTKDSSTCATQREDDIDVSGDVEILGPLDRSSNSSSPIRVI